MRSLHSRAISRRRIGESWIEKSCNGACLNKKSSVINISVICFKKSNRRYSRGITAHFREYDKDQSSDANVKI